MARTQEFIKNQGLDLTGVGLLAVSATDSMTAHAGGGQASATPILTQMSRFTTVATIADSAVLPSAAAIAADVPASAGTYSVEFTVTNASANSMNVFPATGEAINALGANTAFALAAGKTACFNTTGTAGQWHAILSA